MTPKKKKKKYQNWKNRKIDLSQLMPHHPPKEPCRMGYYCCARIQKRKGERMGLICKYCIKSGQDLKYRPFKVSDNTAYVPVQKKGYVSMEDVFREDFIRWDFVLKKHKPIDFLEIGDMAFQLVLKLKKEGVLHEDETGNPG